MSYKYPPLLTVPNTQVFLAPAAFPLSVLKEFCLLLPTYRQGLLTSLALSHHHQMSSDWLGLFTTTPHEARQA